MKNMIAKEFTIKSHCMVNIPEGAQEFGEPEGTLPVYINLKDGYHLMLMAESGYRYAGGENKGNSSLLDSYRLCSEAVDFIRRHKQALFDRQVTLSWFGRKLDDIFEKITDCHLEIGICLLSEEQQKCFYWLEDDYFYGPLLCIAKKDSMEVATIKNTNTENEKVSSFGFVHLDGNLGNYRLWLVNDPMYSVLKTDSEIYSRPIELVYEQPLLTDYTAGGPQTVLAATAYVTVDIAQQSVFPQWDDEPDCEYDD